MQKIIIVVDIYRPWALDSLSFMTFTTTYAKSSLVLHYSNVDWARNHINQKSTTTYIYFFFWLFLISQQSKKQIFVVRSNTKIEYRAFLNTKYDFFFLLQWLLKNLGVSTLSITSLYCNNRSAIQIIHNDIFHEQTKYIKIYYHFFLLLSSCPQHSQAALYLLSKSTRIPYRRNITPSPSKKFRLPLEKEKYKVFSAKICSVEPHFQKPQSLSVQRKIKLILF